MSLDDQHFERFVRNVVDFDRGCVELTVWGAQINTKTLRVERSPWPRTVAGWFDDARALRLWAGRIEGVSGYVTFNPVHKDKVSFIGNKMDHLMTGEGTKASDILSIDRILIDIDCTRRDPKTSATRAELAAALDLRNTVLASEPDVARGAVWGCSGNGAFILAATGGWPNDKTHVALVKKFLVCLAEQYGKKGRDHAYIDVNPHFPNAHVGMPGLLKAKGTSTENRPHRRVTIEGGF
jgi:hypothetical protein